MDDNVVYLNSDRRDLDAFIEQFRLLLTDKKVRGFAVIVATEPIDESVFWVGQLDPVYIPHLLGMTELVKDEIKDSFEYDESE